MIPQPEKTLRKSTLRKPKAVPKFGARGSVLELQLAAQIAFYKLPEPQREFHFHGLRKWRFDFAWPLWKIAVEVEGGTWNGGAHSRGKGYENDCTKYNAAAQLGWRVFRFTTDMVKDGRAIAQIREVLAAELAKDSP